MEKTTRIRYQGKRLVEKAIIADPSEANGIISRIREEEGLLEVSKDAIYFGTRKIAKREIELRSKTTIEPIPSPMI